MEIDKSMFENTPKSSVKLIKNTKGVQWEIKIVSGEEDLIEGLRMCAITQHKLLEDEFKSDMREGLNFEKKK
jgi:hypothetical protein